MVHILPERAPPMTSHDLSGDTHVSETKQDWADKAARLIALDYRFKPLRPDIAQALRDEREACAKVAEEQKLYCQGRSRAEGDVLSRVWAMCGDTAGIILENIRTREDKP